MTAFTIDLAIVFIMAFCIWQGYRKGLILSVAGILIIFISALGAGKIAATNAVSFSEKIQPVLEWVVDDAIDQSVRVDESISGIEDNARLLEVCGDVFTLMGVSEKESKKLAKVAVEHSQKASVSVREAIAGTFLLAIAYLILVILSFVVIMIVLTIAVYFIASIFKLPVIKHFDKYGGLALGLLTGILIVGIIGFALRYTGKIISPEVIQKTFFLKLFSKISVLSANLKF